jgi:hypothetical protein
VRLAPPTGSTCTTTVLTASGSLVGKPSVHLSPTENNESAATECDRTFSSEPTSSECASPSLAEEEEVLVVSRTQVLWSIVRYVGTATVAGFAAASQYYPGVHWIAIGIAVLGTLGFHVVPTATQTSEPTAEKSNDSA